jgi:hypothetical protein
MSATCNTAAGPVPGLEHQRRTRLLLTVSPTHKHLAMRAFAMQQVVTWTVVIGLIVVHDSYPSCV